MIEHMTKLDATNSQDADSQTAVAQSPAYGERVRLRGWNAPTPEKAVTNGRDHGVTLQDSERTRCEVWTRVMGYHRPVSAFNAGKRAEHAERRYFIESR